MKLIKNKFFFCLFALICATAFAENNTQSILDFNVQEIKLGCSLEEFKNCNKFHFKYDSDLSDPANGVKVYESDDVPNIDFCIFRFFDDKLYEVRIAYLPSTSNKLGGWSTILSKLIERYNRKFDKPSKPDKDAIFQGNMNFEQEDRYLYTIVYSDYMIIEFTDKDTYTQMMERKENNIDFGF